MVQEPFDVTSSLAKNSLPVAQKWLQLAAPFYSADYHRSLGEMYIHDARFTDYYDQKLAKAQPAVYRQSSLITQINDQ